MKPREKKMLSAFRALSESDQQSVQDFIAFLAQRDKSDDAKQPIPAPLPTAPIEGESVVAAIKRLSAAFFMLDKSKMLDETSTLVTQHVMQGRDKVEVIQELESVFQQHYQRLCEDDQQ